MTARSIFVLGRPLGATLLLGAAILAGVAGVGVGWADLSAATEERDAKADLLERGLAASRRGGPLGAGAVKPDPFVTAETGTLAAASLDARVRSLALASAVSLMSSRADAKPDEGGLGTRLEVQAVMEGQNEALQAVLLKLETGDPVVLVDALSLEPAEVDRNLAGDPQAPRLRLTVTLSAFWRESRT